MNAKKIIFLLFALIILLVPMYVIFSTEGILEHGHRHKLHLQGYDPFDPFRGKYLRLNYDSNVHCSEDFEEGDDVYVTFEKDSLGFSYFANASSEKPDHDDYMKSKVTWADSFWDVEDAYKSVNIELDNLTKYFINEDKDLLAEEILETYSRDHPNDIYVAIRVLDGEARIEDIYVEETPLLEFIEKQ